MSKISDREIGAIREKIDDIHKTLVGNGQPGLVQNFNGLKGRVDKFEGGMTFISWFIGVFGVLGIVTLGAVLKLYLS